MVPGTWDGGLRKSNFALSWTEGIERVRSQKGLFAATPAGSSTGMSLPWKRIVEVKRRRERRVWRRTMARFPPAESPARTILLAGTAECRDPGGGEMRER